MRRGEDERPAALMEKFDQFARAANVAADRANGLAERADLNIHAAVTAEMIHRAAAIASEDARGMRIVNHHHAAVFFGEGAEFRKRGDVAIHGENAVGDEELAAVPVFRLLQDALAVGEILVLENLDGGFGEAAPIDDGGVIQLVGNDEVVLAENGGDCAGVRREAGLKDDAGFRALESRDLLFELHVNLHGANDAADGAGANAVFADGIDGGAAKLGMRRQAEVIIRAEIDDFLAVDRGDGLLLAFEDAQAKRLVLGFQIFERVAQELRLRAGGRY